MMVNAATVNDKNIPMNTSLLSESKTENQVSYVDNYNTRARMS